MKSLHVPVMSAEVIAQLRAKQGGDYVDCTLGGGGHSQAILKANSKNSVLAFDRDQQAVKRAKLLLQEFNNRIEIVCAPFSTVERYARGRRFDGVLADLGLSTDQLHEQRGFSFNDQGPLDMRMDQAQALSADLLLNTKSFHELFVIFKQGGVGSMAKSLARAIVKARPIENTAQFVEIIQGIAKKYVSSKKVHPATLVFQALRMQVNQELNELKALLESVPGVVKSGARLAIICFHSLEDRMVASTMRSWQGEAAPASWPGATSRKGLGTIVTKKALVPSEQEIECNKAARSARLRVFEFC